VSRPEVSLFCVIPLLTVKFTTVSGQSFVLPGSSCCSLARSPVSLVSTRPLRTHAHTLFLASQSLAVVLLSTRRFQALSCLTRCVSARFASQGPRSCKYRTVTCHPRHYISFSACSLRVRLSVLEGNSEALCVCVCVSVCVCCRIGWCVGGFCCLLQDGWANGRMRQGAGERADVNLVNPGWLFCIACIALRAVL